MCETITYELNYNLCIYTKIPKLIKHDFNSKLMYDVHL